MTTINVEQRVASDDSGATEQDKSSEASTHSLWSWSSALLLRILRHLGELGPCLAGIRWNRHVCGLGLVFCGVEVMAWGKLRQCSGNLSEVAGAGSMETSAYAAMMFCRLAAATFIRQAR